MWKVGFCWLSDLNNPILVVGVRLEVSWKWIEGNRLTNVRFERLLRKRVMWYKNPTYTFLRWFPKKLIKTKIIGWCSCSRWISRYCSYHPRLMRVNLRFLTVQRSINLKFPKPIKKYCGLSMISIPIILSAWERMGFRLILLRFIGNRIRSGGFGNNDCLAVSVRTAEI